MELLHYGMKERSGRYEWGSGEDPYQRLQPFGDLLDTVNQLKTKKGYSEAQIAEHLQMSQYQLRKEISAANARKQQTQMDTIRSGLKRGESNVIIAKRLGVTEGSVRHLIKKMESDKEQARIKAEEKIKEAVKKHKFVDVTESDIYLQLGISKSEFNNMVRKIAEEEGLYVHRLMPKRLDNYKQRMEVRVLSDEPDLEVIKKNSHNVVNFEETVPDVDMSLGLERPPITINPDRVKIRYKEDGGENYDGLIQLRRGAEDLDLGGSNYAQVRIKVGDGHYLKGMAVYGDDIPKGVDIVFNTNKSNKVSKLDVLKPLKDVESNPFGATIKRQKGALNIVEEEGGWFEWRNTWSSQFLSKQPASLVKERMKATLDSYKKEYEQLKSLTNPSVKRYLLEEYARSLDTRARDLKLQGEARTKNHVILPFTDLKPNEVYAPNYKDGERVVLIRHPHGGRFEIAELTVNNKDSSAKKTINKAKDAIGIHPSVAGKLSGADFDGDTVLVIPNNLGKIKSQKTLEGLKNFDPKMYQVDYETMSAKTKQNQMGIVSNLITDMTIKKAPLSDIERAVRHSMVVIDAYKHKLDYKASAKKEGIAELQKRYQSHIGPDGKRKQGASTIISVIDQDYTYYTKAGVEVDPISGKRTKYPEGNRTVKLLDYVGDARKLSSGTQIEDLYADYSNKTRALKNDVIKEIQTTPKQTKVSSVSKQYSKEVASLNEKLKTAKLNAPRERQAQLIANRTFYDNFDKTKMSNEDIKKLKKQAKAGARKITGAKAQRIKITPNEWEAIQAGAISHSTLYDILRNANKDDYIKYAIPKTNKAKTASNISRAKAMSSNGYSYGDIAAQLGVSLATVQELINE